MLILSKDSANREQNSHARLSFFAEMQLILSKDSANRTLLHSVTIQRIAMQLLSMPRTEHG